MPPGATLGEGVGAGAGERGLTNEPLYQGEPILAVAAVDELTAAEAIERSTSTSSRCPSSSIRSRACGRAARTRDRGQRLGTPRAAGASRAAGGPPAPAAARDAEVDRGGFRRRRGEGQLPMGKAPEEWPFGDVEAGFKNADLVLDETFVVAVHRPSAARNAQRDGLLAERQAVPARLHAEHRPHRRAVARWVGIDRRRRRADQRVHRRRIRQQGSRAPSRWRFRRCSRRRPTRR